MGKGTTTKARTKTQNRIDKFIRSMRTRVLNDPEIILAALKKKGIPGSITEVKAILERFSQEEFAKDVGDSSDAHDDSVIARKEEPMQKAPEKKKKDKTALAKEKRAWARDRWIKNPEISKNRMLQDMKLVKKFFGEGTDWGSLCRSKDEADAIIIQNGGFLPAVNDPNSGALVPLSTPGADHLVRVNGNGSGHGSAHFTEKIRRYICGEEEPPRGVSVSVEVHIEAHELNKVT